MKHELIFSGIGGQGVLLSGQVLCSAAVKEGYMVTWAPVYGQEKRGGRTMCQMVISDDIGSPIVSEAEIVLVMDEGSLRDYESRVSAGGRLILNSSMIDIEPVRSDIHTTKIPFNDIARSAGNTKSMNMIALGCVLKYFDLIPVDKVKAELADTFSAKPELIELNQSMLQLGYDYSG
jgi:2-oxoglutarate ferredoxin oxidoreductase subunit gamma